jgi:hypothetical protein
MRIPFEGFYESVHSELIDDAIDLMVSDDRWDAPEGIYERLDYTIDYKRIEQAYCSEYVSWYNQMIIGQTDFDPKLAFELLTHPREYNFTTDTLYSYLTKPVLLHMALNIEFDVLEKHIKKNFTSYDGFMSFYSNDLYSAKWFEVPLDQWDYNMLGTLFTAYLDQLGYKHSWDDLYEYKEEIYDIVSYNLTDKASEIIAEAYELNYGVCA